MMTWRELLLYLPKMTEPEIKRALDAERDGAQRVTVLLKLHQRYSAVRKSRERRELMA
jgi:hypothetical protein